MTDCVNKSKDYYTSGRPELMAFIERVVTRIGPSVLNVGCAAGMDADRLRQMGAQNLHGIEPVTAPAELAAQRYDRVWNSAFEMFEPSGDWYDTILLADVLEHMADPSGALRRIHEMLAPDGRLIVSVPNVRHVSVLFGLIARGDWRYEAAGIMDSTHLRFFTSRSIERLLDQCGYHVRERQWYGMQPIARAITRCWPFLGEFLQSQVFLLAERR